MIKWIWAIIYRKWLWNNYYKCYDTVVKVHGWRCATVDDKARRRKMMWPCFWWFK